MSDQPPPPDAELVDSMDETPVDVQLPTDEDIAALRQLARSMTEETRDARAREAIERGFLKDLAPVFDPETRTQPPGRQNAVSAKNVPDLADLLDRFDAAADALGFKGPSPSQQRYAGPEVRLRFCRIAGCDLSMRQIRWPLSFTSCRWGAPGIFMGATFAAQAVFRGAVFENGADFGLARFQADASFSGSAFHASGQVSGAFAGVSFSQRADFDLTTFGGAVQFDYATFEGEIRFFRSRFGGHAGFAEAKFLSNAQFEFAAFTDQVDFKSAVFDRAPDFHEASFAGALDFSNANFQEFLDLRHARFAKAARLNVADVRIRASTVLAGNVRLTSGQLRQWRWWPPGAQSVIEGDSAATIRADSKREFRAALSGRPDAPAQAEARRKHQKKLKLIDAKLSAACLQYGVLEENFRAQGDPDSRGAEDFCHYRYHDLWRQTQRHPCNPLRWANWLFLKVCFGYGVYPLRILIAGVMLIIFFACIHATSCFGLVGDNWSVETERLVTVDKAAHSSPGFARGETEQITEIVHMSGLDGWHRWGMAMYFSITTFTTIGYGDWHPTGWAPVAAATEGLLGVFIMSVFTVSFARKIVR